MAEWRVNLLCLLGALIGLASFFMVWGMIEGTNTPEWPLRDFLALESYREWAKPFASLFLIGCVIAFITPLGGLLEIAGVAGFLIGVVPDLDGGGIGLYVGVLSALIVTFSMIVPLGPGFKWGVFDFKSNFLTFAPVTTSTLRVNLLCVFGAVLGLAAMLIPWASEGATLFGQLFYYVGSEGGGSTLTVSYAAWLFLVGTLIALLSPAGGILQAGSVGYLATAFGNSAVLIEGSPSLGFFLAVVAAVVVLSSAFRPWGPGWKGLKPRVADRLRTWASRTPAPSLPSIERDL